MIIMMAFAGPIGRFVDKHPSIQVLGLSFLILIGFMLIVEGAHSAHLMPPNVEIPKGYMYFAIFFSFNRRISQYQGASSWQTCAIKRSLARSKRT